LSSTVQPHELSSGRQWLLVVVATLCGLVAAYNIGKVPPSVPALRDEFQTSLTWIASLAGSYSVMAMTCSLLMGSVVGRIGLWRTTVMGLVLLAVGGALGATTNNFFVLLASRVVEGLGYLAIAVSMPAFVSRVCSEQNRSIALGVWGTFIPAGTTLCMLLAPLLAAMGGWRLLWWLSVCMAVLLLMVVTVVMRPVLTGGVNSAAVVRPGLGTVINSSTLTMVMIFALYSLFFSGMVTFLPTYWSETAGLTVDAATKCTALVVGGNIIGNLLGGWLNRTSASTSSLFRVGLALSGLFCIAAYLQQIPFELQLVAAIIFALLGGIVPSTMFVTVARIASTPAQNGLLVGLLFQGAGFGQVVGPILFGAMIDHLGGWSVAPLYFIVCLCLSVWVVSRLPAKVKPL